MKFFSLFFFILIIGCANSSTSGNEEILLNDFYEGRFIKIRLDKGWSLKSDDPAQLLEFIKSDDVGSFSVYEMEILSHSLGQLDLSNPDSYYNFIFSSYEENIRKASNLLQSWDSFELNTGVAGYYYEFEEGTAFYRNFIFSFNNNSFEVRVFITGNSPIGDQFDDMIRTLKYLGPPGEVEEVSYEP